MMTKYGLKPTPPPSQINQKTDSDYNVGEFYNKNNRLHYTVLNFCFISYEMNNNNIRWTVLHSINNRFERKSY